MELMYKEVVYVGGGVLAAALLILVLVYRKSKYKFLTGTKAANTARIRSSKLYKTLTVRYLALSVVMIISLIGGIGSAIVLAACCGGCSSVLCSRSFPYQRL